MDVLGGYIKLFRALLDSPVFESPWLLKLFVWCLLKANFQSSRWRGEVLAPGQFVTGRNAGSDETHASPSRWYRGMQQLEALKCVTLKANSGWTTVTVCNWSRYQDAVAEVEQPADSQRTGGDTSSGHSKKNPKKGRREEGKECKREDDCSFDEFWLSYPRKVSKEAAAHAFGRAVERICIEQGVTPQQARASLVASAREFAPSPKARGQFCPYPATWLNQGRWADDRSEWQLAGDDKPKRSVADRAHDAGDEYLKTMFGNDYEQHLKKT